MPKVICRMARTSFDIATAKGSWNDLFKVLREQGEARIEALASQYPEFESELLGLQEPGTKDLGAARQIPSRVALGRSVIEEAVGPTVRSLEQALRVTESKLRIFARMRLGSGAMSLVGSAGVLAALPLSAGIAAVGSGLVAAVASFMNLWATYFEDQEGGAGKVRIVREKLLEQVGIVAMVKSKLTLGQDTQSDEDIISMMSNLSSVASELHKARAILRMGLFTASS